MLRRVSIAGGLILAFSLGVLAERAERLPSGTEMVIRLDTEVAPGNRDTDQFSAVLAYPVFAGGREVLPAGTRIDGEVRGSKKQVLLSPRYLYLPDGQRINFNAAVREIDRKRLRAEQKEGTIRQEGSRADAARQAAEVGLNGAAIGAMTSGTAKGMGIGAAVGVAAVLIGRKIAGRSRDMGVIPAGTQLTLNLTRPLEVPEMIGPAVERRAADPDERRPILRRRDPQ